MVTISSTWDTIAADGDTNSLQPCVRTISPKESKDFKFDPETMVDVGSCAQLVKPHSVTDIKCTILISSNNTLAFSRLLIISESKRAEVLNGSSGEYKFTKSGELLDDSDPEMIMFKIDISLEKPCSDSLKLNLTGVDENCWLLGVFVFLSEGSEREALPNFYEFAGMGKQSRFDLEEMNALLKSTELSDKAQNFKTLFETFQNTPSFPTLNMPAAMVPFLNTGSDTQLRDSNNIISMAANSIEVQNVVIDNAIAKSEINSETNLSSDKSSSRATCDPLHRNLNSGTSGNDFSNCKCHHECCEKQAKMMESAIKQLETKVFNKLTEIETKQEQKMNQILEIISCQRTLKE